MAGYLGSFFLALLWTDGDGQHLAIVIEQAWSITHIMGIVFDMALKCTLFECQCIWGHYFYLSYCRRNRHFLWSSEPRKD